MHPLPTSWTRNNRTMYNLVTSVKTSSCCERNNKRITLYSKVNRSVGNWVTFIEVAFHWSVVYDLVIKNVHLTIYNLKTWLLSGTDPENFVRGDGVLTTFFLGHIHKGPFAFRMEVRTCTSIFKETYIHFWFLRGERSGPPVPLMASLTKRYKHVSIRKGSG